MHVIEFHITLKDGTDLLDAQDLRESLLACIRSELSHEGQTEAVVGSSLEIN